MWNSHRNVQRFVSRVFLGVCLMVPTVGDQAVWAQTDDPFGRPAANDPFAPRPKSDVVKVNRAKASPANQGETNAKERIEAALQSKTTQTFIEVPLAEAMQVIADTHEIPILLDHRALEEIGLDSDVGVTIDLKDVSLRSFLRLMLRDLDMTYVQRDEVMVITTVEAAEDALITEIYTLPKSLASKSEVVSKAITAVIVPDTWEVIGGPSTIVPIEHVIVVSTTSDVHSKIDEFLEQLAKAFEKPVATGGH